jgi:hypothetical protein
MYRYFPHAQSYNYIEELQKFVDTLKRKGFRFVLLLLSVENCLGQYIFHHKLISLPLVTLFCDMPCYSYQQISVIPLCNYMTERVGNICTYDQWDVDLMDMTKFSKYNCGYNFILVAIDIFSKYVWLRPLKDKRGESVMKALKNIFAEGRSPIRTNFPSFLTNLFNSSGPAKLAGFDES